MATLTIERGIATRTVDHPKAGFRGKVKDLFSMASRAIETYSERKLRYLEEEYGEEWWRNRRHM